MILNFSKKINVISLKYDTLTNLTNSTLPLWIVLLEIPAC